jgi:hypothetical protein
MLSYRNILKALTQSLKIQQRFCHSKATKSQKDLLTHSSSIVTNSSQHAPLSNTIPSGKKVVISAYPQTPLSSNSTLSGRKLTEKEIKETVEVMDRERSFDPYGH